MTSTLHWKIKIQYLFTLQVSRYCRLVLQSCTVSGVPAIEYRVYRCLSCVTALLVEQGNITFGWAVHTADIQNMRSHYTEW